MYARLAPLAATEAMAVRSAKGILLGLAVGLAATAWPDTPALAACADDLKPVKEEFNRVRDYRKRTLLKTQISAADGAIKRKNETGCKRALAEAKKILKQRP